MGGSFIKNLEISWFSKEKYDPEQNWQIDFYLSENSN